MPTEPSHLLVDSSDPFERGRQRGRFAGARLGDTWPVYLDIFAATVASHERQVDPLAVAAACEGPLGDWCPDLLTEIAGVAAGAGLDPLTVLALNARTEVLAHAGSTATECSTVVEMPAAAAETMSVQTWDWHAELAGGWHTQTVRGDRHSFTGLTEHGVLAKIGVNDAGVGLHFNLLRHRSDGAPVGQVRGGVPVHLVARRVLGRAGSLADAVAIIQSAPLCASTVFTVVTEDDAVAVEASPDGVGLVGPADGWLVHTNHFLDDRLAAGERPAAEPVTTYDRQRLLRERVKAVAEPLDVPGLMGLLLAHPEDGAPVCRHPEPSAAVGSRTGTLAVVGLDPAGRRAVVAPGGPCVQAPMTTLTAA